MGRLGLAAIIAATLLVTDASAADRIRLAVQRTGTLAWELDIIKAHGLDRAFNLEIERIDLASTEAGKIALKGGSADLMLSDWLWVARERSLGDKLVFYPSSSTLGAVMVPAQAQIKGIRDLNGRKLAVAGGPLDKSWLLLQALALRSGLDLRKQATIVYGAPPLLQQKALQGEHDATLTFWNFCAELESKGFARAVAIEDVMRQLGAKAPVAIVGYTFDSGWGARNKSTVDRFLVVIRQAKDILASSEAEWQRLGPRIGVSDPQALAHLPPALQRGHLAPPGGRRGGRRARPLPRARRGRRHETRRSRARTRRGNVLPARGVSRGGEDRFARPPDHGLVCRLAARRTTHAARPAVGRAHDDRGGDARARFGSISGATLMRVALAFALAMVVGSAIGLVMGRYQIADRLGDPWLVVLLNLPALVIIVLAYVWAGLTETAAIAAVALNKLPIATVTVREGARALDRGLDDMAQVFRMSAWTRMRHVVLPQLAPYLAAAARSGLSLVWKIVLIVELLGRPNGVGFEIGVAFQLFDVTKILTYALAFIAVMLVIETFLVQPLERHVSRWRPRTA